jgi:ubiquinone biosynthesis protein COQ9
MIDPRALILEHILILAPFDGWSEHTMAQAAKRANLDKKAAKLTFPGGISDCLDYFFASEDDELAHAFPVAALAAKRMPERIETLVMAKLERFSAHREAVRRAVASRALPWNVPGTLHSLYRTIDLMWKLAGDTSTDFSYYTKRATLAALYSSTLLYWLNDNSKNTEGTRQFLKRRLADIAAFGKKKKAFKEKMRMI